MVEHGDAAPVNGRLAPPALAPTSGETTVPLATAAGFAVEQILSGELAAPVAYLQDHDEWFVVLAGDAVLEIDGVEHALGEGDWWYLPAGTPHRLVSSGPGTSWLAVRSTQP